MNKSQLVDKIARSTRQTKTCVEETLNEAIELIKKSVKKGDDVTLVGFGTFTRTERQPRLGWNPQTNQKIEIPGMTLPRFRPGKEFVDRVRQKLN